MVRCFYPMNNSISKFYCDILNTCVEVDKCIPRTSFTNGNRVPGWNEHVAPGAS